MNIAAFVEEEIRVGLIISLGALAVLGIVCAFLGYIQFLWESHRRHSFRFQRRLRRGSGHTRREPDDGDDNS